MLATKLKHQKDKIYIINLLSYFQKYYITINYKFSTNIKNPLKNKSLGQAINSVCFA